MWNVNDSQRNANHAKTEEAGLRQRSATRTHDVHYIPHSTRSGYKQVLAPGWTELEDRGVRLGALITSHASSLYYPPPADPALDSPPPPPGGVSDPAVPSAPSSPLRTTTPAESPGAAAAAAAAAAASLAGRGNERMGAAGMRVLAVPPLMAVREGGRLGAGEEKRARERERRGKESEREGEESECESERERDGCGGKTRRERESERV